MRISVSRSRRIGSTAGAVRWMPRSSASVLAGPLEPLRVVDRGGRDGAVPVVGADDLPADVGGLVGDLAGEAGDAGVVVDLDVDLAALHGGLRLGLRLGFGARGSAAGVSLGCSWTTVVTSRSVGSLPRVATNATPAIATAMHAEDHDRGREDHAALVARVPRVPSLRPRSRGGARSAAAGGRRAAGAAGGPAAGRPRGPPGGRSGR